MKHALVGTFALTLVAGLASAQNATSPGAAPMPSPSTNAATSAMVELSTVDTNKDGRVSSAEAQAHSELRTSFATLDTDSDGYLSAAEYGKWNKTGKGSSSSSAAPRPNSDMNSESTPARPATPANPASPARPTTPANPAQ